MTFRLTREWAAGKKLIFYPADADECETLQKKLLDLGFVWSGGAHGVQQVNLCVAQGMVVMDGKIFYRSIGDTQDYTSCSILHVDPDYIPLERRLMLELFNKLSAKVDALSEKVDRLYDEMHPDLGKTKPGLKSAPPPARG